MEMIWFLLVVILMIILAGELLTALIYGVVLKTAFPVNKTVIRQGTDGALKIDHRCEFILADFMRNRYPDRFMKQGKVVSGERCCPACGAAFTPDEDGNCIHCGSFLFKENYKWRVVQ